MHIPLFPSRAGSFSRKTGKSKGTPLRPALLTLIFAAAFCTQVRAGTVTVTYSFGAPLMEDSGHGFTRMIFPSTVQAGSPGHPSFPFRSVMILLPEGEEAVGMSIDKDEWISAGSGVTLFPRQHTVPGSGISSRQGEFVIDRQAYEADRWTYPADSQVRTHYLRGHAIAVGGFSPGGFHPLAKEAGYYRKVTVTVETAPSRSGRRLSGPSRVDPGTLNTLRSLIDNPAALSAMDGPPPLESAVPVGYAYLIITGGQFGDDFAPLRDFYNRRGLRTRIETVEDITAGFEGDDAAEKIRNAIRHFYSDYGIDYVLLGGDVEVVPYRGFHCIVMSSPTIYEDDNIPADIYFANLDGSWNDDGDHLWGELYEEDIFGEVYVGRASVSTEAEIATFIRKTTMYQEAPVVHQLEKALLLGEMLNDDPLTYGGNEMDELIDTCTAHGYSTTGMPPAFDFTKYYDRDLGGWSGMGVVPPEVSAGTHWVFHSGHCNVTYALRLGSTAINLANFLNDGINANYTIVNTIGCNLGAFEYYDCIGERMVNIEAFAAAAVCNSRYGFYEAGTTNGTSHHFQREFADAIFNEGYTHLGAANQISKDQSAPYMYIASEEDTGAYRWAYYCLNLLGDPALDCWTSEPSPIYVSHPGAIEINDSYLTVETDAPGALGAVSRNGSCFATATAGPSGSIVFDLQGKIPADVDKLVITVTSHDRLFYCDSITVHTFADEEETPRPLSLLQNRPNPFNPATMITFSLSRDGHADLRVFDAAGREVSRLISGRMEAGVHTVRWWPEGLASGVYFYHLKAEGRTLTRKAVLIR